MTEDRATISSIHNFLPAGWKAILERAAGADGLELEDALSDEIALAERLTDLGLLRVPRAGHYGRTPAGQEMLKEADLLRPSKTAKRRIPVARLVAGAVVFLIGALVWLRL